MTCSLLHRSSARLVACLVPVAVLTAFVQPALTVDAQARSFEVASVRQNVSGLIPSRLEITRGGELRIVNMPLRNIIRQAYGIYVRGPRPNATVENEPDWLSDRFDVLAKADPPGQRAEYELMLQALLAERFKLAVRWTTRQQPVYLLTLARNDGRWGPGLTRPKVGCSPSGPKPDADLSQEEITQLPARCGMRGAAASLEGVDAPLSSLIEVLVSRLMRPVIDRTGLDGRFDISLSWRPDGVQGAAPGASVSGGQPLAVDLAQPTLIDAVEEQLGLRLEPGAAPMDVLEIDRIDRLVPE
jgi:uncharacterized protein (TIGR03435 family)